MAKIPLLIFLALLRPQQQDEALVQQLQQVQQELRQQRQQLGKVSDAVDQARRDPKSTCAAELQWLNGVDSPGGKEPIGAAFTQTTMIPLNLFSAVSRPQELCLPGELRVTASYFDTTSNLICSGVVEGVVGLNGIAQNINLEIRPWNLEYFVRWSNDPSPSIRPATRLGCVGPDGLDQVPMENMLSVSSVRIRITAFPKAGGLSTVEVRINRR